MSDAPKKHPFLHRKVVPKPQPKPVVVVRCGGYDPGRSCAGTGVESSDAVKPHLAALAADLGNGVDPATVKFLTVTSRVVAGWNIKYTGTAGSDGRQFVAHFFRPSECDRKEGDPELQFQSASWLDDE